MTAPLPTGVYGAARINTSADGPSWAEGRGVPGTGEQHTPGAAFDDWTYAQQVAAEIREQETNRQLQTGMAEKEGGQ